ncbi:MAG TPA: arylesterase [Xanthomonadaceae bacterium]|nr:arylesterase [Xanthomonadaceae bacterium]
MFVWVLIVSPALAEPPRPILVLGDSLSAAFNMPAAAGWVTLLEARLQTTMEAPPPVVNASISGETSAGGLSRLPALLDSHRPGLVLIALGGNDGLRGLPPAQFRANLQRMIALSREAGAKVMLAGVEIPPNYGSAYRDRFRAVYHDLASEHDVPLLPFILDGIALEPGMMQADGIHPTEEAQAAILENVWGVLGPMVGGEGFR